jgi:hypothetical protein
MPKRAWVVAFVFGGAAVSATEGAEHLELVWLDHRGLVREVDGVLSEAERIFRELGVSVRSEVGSDPRPPEDGVIRVHVVLMPSEPAGWKLPENAMGAVLRPGRTVFLFHPAILRSVGLGPGVASMPEPREGKDLARAIGRVIVHEVVHALVPAIEHADSGLMRDSLPQAALASGRISVDEASRAALRRRLGLVESPRRTEPPH